MKRDIMTYATICIISIVIISCDFSSENRYSLELKNNSNVDVCFYFYLVWEGGSNGVVYPDTFLTFGKEELVCLNSKNKYRTSRSGVNIEEWVSSLPNDTLSIFIFSNDTLNKYDWSDIQSGYKVLQRYDLSSEDIKDLYEKCVVIPYPPTKSMRYMKMYPPYRHAE